MALDLILTNEEFIIEDLGEIAPLGKSDHVGLTWTYVCNSCISTKDDKLSSGPNFNKGEYDQMRQHFKSTDWEKKMSSLDCEDAWKFLRETYDKAVDDYVPKKRPNKKMKQPWLCAMVKKTIKTKYNLYNLYNRN